MAADINKVVLVGRLTRDPELKGSGTSVCAMRIAVNSRQKSGDEWTDAPNYFDVTVFGKHGENCAKYLAKGRPVAVEGRLRWREWESDGGKRQAVDIVADNVQFLGSKDENGGRVASDIPADTSGLPPVGAASPASAPVPF